MDFTIKRLPSGIGAECIGLDLRNPLSTSAAKKLYDAWIDAGILVFKKLGKSPEDQINLSRCFGTLDIHPAKNLRTESQYPELMVLDSEVQQKLSVYYREPEPEKPFVGFISWHSDLIFTTTPNHGAMLRAVTTPRQGGQTAWIDTIAAYDALSEEMKARIEGLELEYRFSGSLLNARYGRDPSLRMQIKGEWNFPAFPPVAQPLVWRHPVSGRKVLNLSPLHLERVLGMDDKESDELLTELVAHVTHQQFSYVHEWDVDDMVLWDNWRTLHSPLGYPLGDRRLVHRTTIGGNVQMGRVLEEAMSA